jgi:glycosyltransferase involved in cell wall biosynthesis
MNALSTDSMRPLRDRSRLTRVVHVATRLPVGGMENVVASLVEGLPRQRYESGICCLEEADRLGLELRARGAEIVELGRRRRRELGLFFRLANIAAKKRVDILHCHDELSWFYGTVSASLAGVPLVIVTMHGRRFNISTRHLLEQRVLSRRTACVISVSDYLRGQLQEQLRLRSDRLVTIHNGIPLPPPVSDEFEVARARHSLGLPVDAVVVGCVGELSRIKNFELAIDAVAEVRRVMPSVRLVLIGDGPCRRRLETKVRDAGLRDGVHFAGLRRDVAQLWPVLDIYVCSSDYEGISLSVLEAMASSRAVIATAVGGNSEIIHHNETGLLVPARDTRALATAILSLVGDAPKRYLLGQQAEALVRSTYAVGKMLDRYDSLYQRLISASRDGNGLRPLMGVEEPDDLRLTKLAGHDR